MDISLVITTFNRDWLLDKSLERLKDLTPPAEIIVVDDGGRDDTEGICAKWAGQGNLPSIKYVYNDNPGSTICSLARNIGFRMAENEWVATSEPELVFRSDVLAQYAQLQPEHPSEVISSGTVYFATPGFNPMEDPEPLERAGDYTPGSSFQKAIGWVAPYTGLWKKEWVEEVRGWDETFPGPWGWDDIDLLTRLRINGHGQYIALEIEAIHQFHGLGGDKNFINEGHFKGKSFQGGEHDLTDVIANRGHEWGCLRS